MKTCGNLKIKCGYRYDIKMCKKPKEKMNRLQLIVDLGMLRIQNKCANCKRKMDIKNYNIQLCKRCRILILDDFYSKMQEIEFMERKQ